MEGPALEGSEPLVTGAVSLGLGCLFTGLLSQMTLVPFTHQAMICVTLEQKSLLWVLFIAIHDDESGETVPMPTQHLT